MYGDKFLDLSHVVSGAITVNVIKSVLAALANIIPDGSREIEADLLNLWVDNLTTFFPTVPLPESMKSKAIQINGTPLHPPRQRRVSKWLSQNIPLSIETHPNATFPPSRISVKSDTATTSGSLEVSTKVLSSRIAVTEKLVVKNTVENFSPEYNLQSTSHVTHESVPNPKLLHKQRVGNRYKQALSVPVFHSNTIPLHGAHVLVPITENHVAVGSTDIQSKGNMADANTFGGFTPTSYFSGHISQIAQGIRINKYAVTARARNGDEFVFIMVLDPIVASSPEVLATLTSTVTPAAALIEGDQSANPLSVFYSSPYQSNLSSLLCGNNNLAYASLPTVDKINSCPSSSASSTAITNLRGKTSSHNLLSTLGSCHSNSNEGVYNSTSMNAIEEDSFVSGYGNDFDDEVMKELALLVDDRFDDEFEANDYDDDDDDDILRQKVDDNGGKVQYSCSDNDNYNDAQFFSGCDVHTKRRKLDDNVNIDVTSIEMITACTAINRESGVELDTNTDVVGANLSEIKNFNIGDNLNVETNDLPQLRMSNDPIMIENYLQITAHQKRRMVITSCINESSTIPSSSGSSISPRSTHHVTYCQVGYVNGGGSVNPKFNVDLTDLKEQLILTQHEDPTFPLDQPDITIIGILNQRKSSDHSKWNFRLSDAYVHFHSRNRSNSSRINGDFVLPSLTLNLDVSAFVTSIEGSYEDIVKSINRKN